MKHDRIRTRHSFVASSFCFQGGIFIEIKVNREIRNYNEALFLGLSLRQLVFSALAILVAVGVYFLLRTTLSLETLSWLCVLCAAPFAALGFVTYNGMTAEKLLLCIHNRRMNQSDLHRDVLIPHAGDGLDHYRDEYNQILLDKVQGASAYCQDKYITVTVTRHSLEDARSYFSRIGAELGMHFSRLGSKCEPLKASERLNLFHDILRGDSSGAFCFDPKEPDGQDKDFLDAICPDRMEIKWNHFSMDGKYGRVLWLKEYASFIRDTLVTDLTALNREILLSIDILPVPMDEAIREVNKRSLGTETSINTWQRRQNQHQNYTAVLPPQLEQQRQENREFMNDLTSRNQRMMLCAVTLVHFADSLDALNDDTEAIRSISDQLLCQFHVLHFQQLEGLKTVLPYGCRKISALRTLTTESLAALMPFRVQEILDQGGIYYGENSISKNLILINKSRLMNPGTFCLGVPGGGKSFLTKETIIFLLLSTNGHILVFDPEGEYADIARALHGAVADIASGGREHINLMDLTAGYSDENNPVSEESEFLMAVFERINGDKITSKQRSILDRCTRSVYEESRIQNEVPTLFSLRDKLLQQPEPEAKELALMQEAFTSGSLDVFAHPTNVDTGNRFVVYDTHKLGEQLKPLAFLVITDAIRNRVALNSQRGIRTHIILDEFHVAFGNEHSASFFASAWRQFRKRNGYPTAITQNVEFLMDSVLAKTMLSNSELVVMLNQAAGDREKLAQLFHISEDQMSYITNAGVGCGLIRYGSTLVPFQNQFPRDTDLYRLMTTDPNEKFL